MKRIFAPFPLKAFFMLLVIALLSSNLSAQDSLAKPKPLFAFYLVPQTAAVKGLRFMIDHSLKDRSFMISAGPEFYLGREDFILTADEAISPYGYSYYDQYYVNGRLFGAGASVFVKKLTRPNRYSTPYFALGATARYFVNQHEEYTATTSSSFTEWEPTGKEVSEKMMQLGVQLVVGYNVSIDDLVFFDFYTGVGLQLGRLNGSWFPEDPNISSILDRAYSGILPVGVIRVGIPLN